MSDDPTPLIDDLIDDPGDDATQQAVRRLLADARHTAPMPTDLAARLDGVLADLHRSRPAAEPQRSAVVVPIASRRRRRLATGLVAAAAVVAVGVALPDITGLGGSSDTASDTAADGGAASDQQLTREDHAESRAEADNPGAGEPGPEPGATVAPPTVSPDRFKRDAQLARPQAVTSSAATGPVCGVLPVGDAVPVRYEDRDGYLVFGATASARQRVALYLCPEGELERRAVIPAP